ncbi:MAG: signal peptidase II [Lachnospiraceae bacterium]|nr:signal peptidase II [Lachnospiraceae bacterium]
MGATKEAVKRLLPFAGAALIAGTDLYIKNKMDKELPKEGEEAIVPVKKYHLIFHRYHNKGAFLNLGEKYPDKVKMASAIACGGVFGALYSSVIGKGTFFEKLGYTFLLGGAMSNTYERVKKGYVMDYASLDVKPAKIRKVVFNLSDVFIFFGSIIVVISSLISKKK